MNEKTENKPDAMRTKPLLDTEEREFASGEREYSLILDLDGFEGLKSFLQ